MLIDLADSASLDFSLIDELAAKGHRHLLALVHRFGEAGTIGQMDCVYSYWLTRDINGFAEPNLVGVARAGAGARARDQVGGPGRYRADAGPGLSRARRFRAGSARAHRARRHRAYQGGIVVLRSARLDRRSRKHRRPAKSFRSSTIMPQAAIDAIHEAGGDVLKLIGDGVLAMFTGEDLAVDPARRAAGRASFPAEHDGAQCQPRRLRGGRPPRPMSGCMSARCSTAISAARTGSISPWSGRRSMKSAGSPRCAVRSIAISWSRRPFAAGLDATGQHYLVSTGRYALRGIGHAQDLFTLDPDVTTDEVVAGGYARYLAS